MLKVTFRVSNLAGEASASTTIGVQTESGLILQPQNEQKARAVEELEGNLRRRPEEVDAELKVHLWRCLSKKKFLQYYRNKNTANGLFRYSK